MDSKTLSINTTLNFPTMEQLPAYIMQAGLDSSTDSNREIKIILKLILVGLYDKI